MVFTCSPNDATLAGAVGRQSSFLKLYICYTCLVHYNNTRALFVGIFIYYLTSGVRALVHPKTRLAFADHGRSGYPKLVPLKFLKPPHLYLGTFVAKHNFLFNDLETNEILYILSTLLPTFDLTIVMYFIMFYVYGVFDNHAVRSFRLNPRHKNAT